MLRRKAIYQHAAPLCTIDQIEEEMSANYAQYGSMFRDKEEFEYFWMLPLNPTQRLQLVDVLKGEAVAEIRLLSCLGSETETPAHRARCVECVCTVKPGMAAPFY